ncbi:hypothetical protein OWM07_03170 [Deferribacter thermophilus]|uniref:hypothetical protein n=1 Tax=Deferribacter thermophilus TaxID=53573 RepID=UPI003C25955B
MANKNNKKRIYKKKMTCLYIDPEFLERLRELSKRSEVSISQLFINAVKQVYFSNEYKNNINIKY